MLVDVDASPRRERAPAPTRPPEQFRIGHLGGGQKADRADPGVATGAVAVLDKDASANRYPHWGDVRQAHTGKASSIGPPTKKARVLLRSPRADDMRGGEYSSSGVKTKLVPSQIGSMIPPLAEPSDVIVDVIRRAAAYVVLIPVGNVLIDRRICQIAATPMPAPSHNRLRPE